MKKMNLSLFVLSSLLFACGKSATTVKSSNSLGRTISALEEGNFTVDEKLLGQTFCTALQFKKNQFANLHINGSLSKFKFDITHQTCTETEEKTEETVWSYNSNFGSGLSYSVVSGYNGYTPTVETDSFGGFKEFCANQTQNSRVFTATGGVVSYHFEPGQNCEASSTDVCAIYEFAESEGAVSSIYKRYVISTGSLSGFNIKGQEIRMVEEKSCGSDKKLKVNYKLKSVFN
jgi:hypothetical protein